MVMVKVLFVNSPPAGRVVESGVSGDTSHNIKDQAKAAFSHVIKDVGADVIASQALALAKEMEPAFRACAQALRKIQVTEISIGCAITVEAGVVIAGVGAEASVEITFDVREFDAPAG